jgi:hypothetical protein
MARRRRDTTPDRLEAGIKAVLGLLCLAALGIGGLQGFGRALTGLIALLLIVVVGGGLLALAGYVGWRIYRARFSQPTYAANPASSFGWQNLQSQPLRPCDRATPGERGPTVVAETSAWSAKSIRSALDEIDWFQFEKFCAALLRADGFVVERKGGAHPDGGVDLVVEKQGVRALIQCKHWRTWVVQEKVIREMLGSMTHFKVTQGAIYTLKGWTAPAANFAAQHAITLVNGSELAASAVQQLSGAKLDELLKSGVHHCPKCESPMVERSGAFGSFWGCSTYPRCRGKLKYAGAR